MSSTQVLDWPRRGVDVPDFFDPFYRQVNVPVSFQDTLFIGEDQIPQEVKDSQMLLAREALTSSTTVQTPLQPTLERHTKREKLGPLEVEYMTAQEGGNVTQLQRFWNAEQRIMPFLLASAPWTGRVVRS